jgi:transcription initiation factor IIE alpha subunit
MANIVNNLRINNTEVKKILIKLREDADFSSLKELYFNGILV